MTEEERAATVRRPGQNLVLQRQWEQARQIEIVDGEGDHGGGDNRLPHDLFRGPVNDPLGRPADYLDGIRSVAVGIAGNASLDSGAAVTVADLQFGANLDKPES